MSRRIAVLIARLATALLPLPLRHWGRAMRAEAEAIEPSSSALLFALGCLGCAVLEAAAFHLANLVAPPGDRHKHPEPEKKEGTMLMSDRMDHRPHHIGILCAIGAVGLGFAYMAAAGAPGSYFVMNGAALVLGIALVVALRSVPRAGRWAQSVAPLAMALALLLTGIWGMSADGAARWVSIGGIALQPSLLLVPVLTLRFARASDGPATLAIVIAALALALQPDRAMAAALLAGTAGLALARPSRNAWIALVAALAGFAITMSRPDLSPAMPHVDRIFFSSFQVHMLAGLAVLAGSFLLVAPALAGALADPANRVIYVLFGAVWLAVIAAAALGNYPTPLVGYGGSAIIGYLVSLTALPPRAIISAAPEPDATYRTDAGAEEMLPRANLSYSA